MNDAVIFGLYFREHMRLILLVFFGALSLTLHAQQAAAPAAKKSGAADLLIARAQSGDADAETDLAKLYLQPNSTPEQVTCGVQWLQKAANSGYPRAQYELGLLFETGHGVTVNEEKAVDWYKKAADSWYAPAEFRLGQCYEKAIGVAVNRAESVRWYQRAAERDLPEAEATMARIYTIGYGGFKSPTVAKAWAMLAVRSGNSECAEMLARIIGDETLDAPDWIEAGKWALLASWWKPPRTAALEEIKPRLSFSALAQIKERALAFEKIREEGGPAFFSNYPDVLPLFKGRAVVEIPAVFNGTEIVLPVSIHGSAPIPLVLDTGASTSLIDLNTVKALDLELTDEHTVSGIGPDAMVAGTVADLSCKIGDLEFKSGSFSSCSLDYIKPYGEKIRGLLGYNFLSRFVVEIDYAKKAVRFHDPAQFHYTATNGSAIIPIHMKDGAIYAPVGVVADGGRVALDDFIIDTGFEGTIDIGRYFMRNHEIFSDVSKVDGGVSIGIGGIARPKCGRIPALTLGSYRLEKPTALFSLSNKGMLANTPTGLVGSEILGRFRVFIDYAHKQLILEPNENFAKPFDGNTHGLGFIIAGTNPSVYKINDILPGSPGEESGFKMGDVLVTLDDKLAGEFSLGEIYHVLSDGKEHVLKVKRGDDILTLKVREREFI